ncbi:MAG: hypothetical protein ACLQVK_15030, partial [Acidimicrobiales bacterium]
MQDEHGLGGDVGHDQGIGVLVIQGLEYRPEWSSGPTWVPVRAAQSGSSTSTAGRSRTSSLVRLSRTPSSTS